MRSFKFDSQSPVVIFNISIVGALVQIFFAWYLSFDLFSLYNSQQQLSLQAYLDFEKKYLGGIYVGPYYPCSSMTIENEMYGALTFTQIALMQAISGSTFGIRVCLRFPFAVPLPDISKINHNPAHSQRSSIYSTSQNCIRESLYVYLHSRIFDID